MALSPRDLLFRPFDVGWTRWLRDALACLAVMLSYAAGCYRSTQPAAKEEAAAVASRQDVKTSRSVSVESPELRFRAGDWFSDETPRSGIDFKYQTGRDAQRYTILETVGGGVGMIDYDLDDDLDLFFPGGGRISSSQISGVASRLYRNDGELRFSDVSHAVGLEAAGDYSHGCAVADYNRDGYPDLFVTCYGRSRLYHNERGERFSDVTEAAGLVVDDWSTAAAWADVDRDGWPDLYVANYLTWSPGNGEFCGDRQRQIRDVCPPQNYPPAQDRLFHNRHDGTFEEVTTRAGLSGQGKGLGVVAADFDEDGWIDFYVANDAGPNHLYRGAASFRLREVGLASGTAVNEYGAAEGSMGVDFGDYNGDGRGDLWVTNFEREDNSLYRNDGGGGFTHATVAAGLAGVGRHYVGFGTGLIDFDADGWLDLFVIDGNVFYTLGQAPFAQPAFLFRNLSGERFSDVSGSGGPFFAVPHAGRGAAAGDLDNDGLPDLVVIDLDQGARILRNRNRSTSWLRLRLRGTASEPDAVGAKVECAYEGRQVSRWVCSGSGYLSQFDQRVLLPAADDGPVDVTVTWLGGRKEQFRHLPVRQTVELVEGEGVLP